ncbi:MAG: PEP-utilizing enzyme, partial [Gammaproteobacteria bacterium]|nr:PEP-utilizing enzyme [Gammaproteobacteria bacterium]
GGMTCHAAVVARGMDIPCVVGCNSLEFVEGGISVHGAVTHEGLSISIDGTSGQVWLTPLEVKPATIPAIAHSVMSSVMGHLNSNMVTHSDLVNGVQYLDSNYLAMQEIIDPEAHTIVLDFTVGDRLLSEEEINFRKFGAIPMQLPFDLDRLTQFSSFVGELMYIGEGLPDVLYGRLQALSFHKVEKSCTIKDLLKGGLQQKMDTDTLNYLFGDHETYTKVITALVDTGQTNTTWARKQGDLFQIAYDILG